MTPAREDADRYYSDSGPRKRATRRFAAALRKLFVRLPFFVTCRRHHPSERIGKMLSVPQNTLDEGSMLLVIKSKHPTSHSKSGNGTARAAVNGWKAAR